jgi:hypothetical protein
MFGADAEVAILGRDENRLAVTKSRDPRQAPHARSFEQRFDASAEMIDDRPDPNGGSGEIDRRSLCGDPEGSVVGAIVQARVFIGGVDQRLRRNAADVETGAAERAGIDDDGVDPELAGANGANVAAGTRTDHQQRT